MYIQQRTPKEIAAFYEGGLNALKLLKTIGCSESDVDTLIEVLKAMKESNENHPRF